MVGSPGESDHTENEFELEEDHCEESEHNSESEQEINPNETENNSGDSSDEENRGDSNKYYFGKNKMEKRSTEDECQSSCLEYYKTSPRP